MLKGYLINLARRTDRKDQFLARNSPVFSFIELQLVDAVDGSNLELTPEFVSRVNPWNIQNLNDKMLRGYLGNGLSHLRCIELIAASDDPFGIVFEDDAELFNHWSARLLSNLCSNLPKSIDLIWLNNWARGASWLDRQKTRASVLASPILRRPLLSKWDASFEKTTEAYIISSGYAATIADTFRNDLGAFDEHIKGYTRRLNGRAAYCRPSLFKQTDRSDSDVR
jgi:GR25 family glycosyltransferase involved in LPS biosynthesis